MAATVTAPHATTARIGDRTLSRTAGVQATRAMLGLGCTIGTLLSGVMAYSLHGWLFAGGLMAGAFLGVKMLRRIA